MKISICIPVYNVEQYIERCINSVLQQSFQDFEIIVVNDATPDDSMKIVESIAEKDSRIRIYNNPHNMGLMWTRREGYKRAEGDYIVFLDSDDTLPNNALSRLYSAISDTDSDIVCGQTAYLTPLLTSLKGFSNNLYYGNDAKSALKSVLRWEITHNLWGKIYKRELLQSHSYFTYENVVNAEDALLFYQILPNINKISTIEDVVYNYYYYDTSSSHTLYSDKALRNIFLAEKQRFDIISNKYPSLLPELYTDMILDLTSLARHVKSKKRINQYLSEFKIPLEINLRSIIKYSPSNKLIRCLLFYYCNNIVKVINTIQRNNSRK